MMPEKSLPGLLTENILIHTVRNAIQDTLSSSIRQIVREELHFHAEREAILREYKVITGQSVERVLNHVPRYEYVFWRYSGEWK